MQIPEKASCWICRRTKLEIEKYHNSTHIDKGELPKWLLLQHLIPLEFNATNKSTKEKGFYICPFCREAIIYVWSAKFLGSTKKANKN